MNTSAFIEKILEGDAPIWYRWDRDLFALQNALTSAATDLASLNPASQAEASEFAGREERLLWLLDRVAPETDSALFERHLGHPRGIYAWGRRLPTERRIELTRFPLPSAPPDAWNRRMVWQALVFAWCDSCPSNQLTSLIRDLEQWLPAIDWHESWYLGVLIEEFYRRCESNETRWEQLTTLLQEGLALSKDQVEATRKFGEEIAWRAWICLLRDTALANPSAEPPPHTEEAWSNWFKRTLSSPSFSRVAELNRDFLHRHGVARWLWIWLHGEKDWEQLYRNITFFSQHSIYFERLVEIVPSDKLEIWESLVICDSDFYRIHAFCKWLPAKYAEVLRDHFHHPDRDWAACTYQNYLAKTQEAILQHWFNLVDDLPMWQAQLLDRRLFAPERIRPSAVLEDIQAVEGDLRLQDPFNHRHY